MACIQSARQAVSSIQSGTSLMVGGFLCAGTPRTLLGALLRQGTDGIRLISNDSGQEGLELYEIIRERRVKELLASYVGRNPYVAQYLDEGTLAVELLPQGTLVERIRAGGAGLGGFLTPTGVGTIVQQGKLVIEVDGREYLLELPLKADAAFIRAHKADTAGNLQFHGTARNMNPIMATAADYVIAEVDEIVDAGDIPADEVHLCGIFVDVLVLREDV